MPEPEFDVDAATKRRGFKVPDMNLTGSLGDFLGKSEWVKWNRADSALTFNLSSGAGGHWRRAVWLHVLGMLSSGRREQFGDPREAFFRTPLLVSREAPLEVAKCMLFGLRGGDPDEVPFVIPLARLLDRPVFDESRPLAEGVFRTTSLRMFSVNGVGGRKSVRVFLSGRPAREFSSPGEVSDYVESVGEPFAWGV